MDFAYVITGYGMLIARSGGMWDVTLDMSEHTYTHAHTHTHFDVVQLLPCRVLFRLEDVFASQLLSLSLNGMIIVTVIVEQTALPERAVWGFRDDFAR